jgi:hypothetical protein
MRILPGAPKEFANETPTSAHLGKYLVNTPEMLPQVTTLFARNITAFSSLLAERNMFSGSIASALNPKGSKYKVVGSRKVMWNVQGYPDRKGRVASLPTTGAPIGFKCDAFPTTPGRNQTVIELYSDTNWFSPRDVIELADNQTFLFVMDNMLPEEISAGVWRYKCRIVTKDPGAFVNPSLLAPGMEFSVSHTAFEEMSETAYEKYTFDEKAYTHLTIQRLKWSISGTAEEMKANKVWIEHNGVNMWTTHAQLKMLERAAQYRENQILFGKSTVTDDDKVLLKTIEGFEVMAGDGILNQGDGAWRMPYNELTIESLETIMENINIYSSAWGQEVAVACGQKFYNNFAKLMKNQAGIDPKVVEFEGGKKGINLDYQYFIFGGVKIIPTVIPWMDSPMRATTYDENGIRRTSHNAIFVSLGDVDIQRPAIELLALGDRSWKEGEVNGINKGGDMANSVDGKHHHILWETGAAMFDVNGIAELYKPVVF